MNCICGKKIPPGLRHICVAVMEKRKIGHPVTKSYIFCGEPCASEWLKLRLPWNECVGCQKTLGRWAHFELESGPICDQCFDKAK